MEVRRIDLYDFIQQQLLDQCYVGLHYIPDYSSTNREFWDINKEEKAKSIVETGLKNSRGGTISLTVRNFGDLSEVTDEKVWRFINYGQSASNEVIIVVAIPYFFNHSDGRKIFGGYIEYEPYGSGNYSEQAKCISDYIFRKHIPPEMILGYYKFDVNSDVAEYVPNNSHYLKLDQSKKDEFIEKYIPPLYAHDCNDKSYLDFLAPSGDDDDSEIFPHCAKTYRQLQKIKKSNNGVGGY